METKIDSSYIPADNTITSDPSSFDGRPPQGFKRLKNPTKEIYTIASQLLSGDYGTITPFSIEGNHYVARVEPHYRSVSFKNKPVGWHKGVTVYEKNDQSTQNNKIKKDISINTTEKKLFEKLDDVLKNIKF